MMEATDCVKDVRWRSTGWAPLVYPDSALLLDSPEQQSNPYFPLQEDVLRATVRELLILDKSVDARTLALSLDMSRFRDSTDNDTKVGPVYMRHVDPNRWDVVPEEKTPKRKNASSFASRKKLKKEDRSRLLVPDESALHMQHTFDKIDSDDSSVRFVREKVQNAEALTDAIVHRSCHLSVMTADPPFLKTENAQKGDLGIPRKVSDADSDVITHLEDPCSALNKIYGNKDVSRFFDIENRNASNSLAVIRTDVPPLLEVSIVSESILRDLAYSITCRLTESFDDKAMRLFLGYKSKALKRERLLYVLSEYLFDVSHAMFAWKQTEQELTSQVGSERLDKQILHTLFDQRALRKIGGFENSSLLPHALSISRVRSMGTTWEQFAQTKSGRALLRHHREGQCIVVGQSRRGQRVRSRHFVGSDADSSEAGIRSRSSSIASYDGMENESGGVESDETCNEHRHLTIQMPDVLHVSLTRAANASWGILLSKEGDMCVVVRAPEQSTDTCLKVGDVILSVRNEKEESVVDAGVGEGHWFRRVVDLFKTSNQLDLIVRRVGSA